MNPKVIVIDGKTYNSVNEMPADVRQQYEQAMRSLGDANNNRVPVDPSIGYLHSAATLIIQLMPKRSVSMPKCGDQNVLANGICTWPPSESAEK